MLLLIGLVVVDRFVVLVRVSRNTSRVSSTLAGDCLTPSARYPARFGEG